jgi:hypothetical protein
VGDGEDDRVNEEPGRVALRSSSPGSDHSKPARADRSRLLRRFTR